MLWKILQNTIGILTINLLINKYYHGIAYSLQNNYCICDFLCGYYLSPVLWPTWYCHNFLRQRDKCPIHFKSSVNHVCFVSCILKSQQYDIAVNKRMNIMTIAVAFTSRIVTTTWQYKTYVVSLNYLTYFFTNTQTHKLCIQQQRFLSILGRSFFFLLQPSKDTYICPLTCTTCTHRLVHIIAYTHTNTEIDNKR